MTSIADIESTLARYVPLSREITGKDLTLGRTQELMAALGNPHKKLKIIHIAGTSGKTSTAYYISNLLTVAGFKVGLTVSPHVDSVLERVQVNMQALDEHEFSLNLSECISIVEAAGIEPTYFELLTAFAYWYFAKQNVDYAVIETGMGGLQDATNVADNPDKICVITDIGLDHMHVLGRTVTEIARQKAGIIHRSNKVLMYRQDEEIMEVMNEQCSIEQAELYLFEQNSLNAAIDVGHLPAFQQRNWLLANEAYDVLVERDGLPELTQEQLLRSMEIQVPGRMDEARAGNKTIIMDGAHNEQKTGYFVRSFMQKFPDTKVPVLLSLKEGKEFAAVLPLLKPITSTLIITVFDAMQDLPAHSIDPHELAAVAKKFGFGHVITEPDQQQAYQALLAQPGNSAIITGSFYLLGQIRRNNPELHHA